MKLTKFFSLLLCLVLAFSLFSCKEPSSDDEKNPPDDSETKTSYKVTVVDQNGDVVVGAKVHFYGTKDGKDYFGRGIEVNANGVAEDTLDAVNGVEIRLPDGYEDLPKDANDFHATFPSGKNEITVTANKIASEDVAYTVIVKDEDGNGIAGVSVQICHSVCLCAIETDADGKMSASFLPGAKVKVKLTSYPEEYTIEAIDDEGYHAYFADGENELVIVLKENMQ